ncbi:hypothetical protein V6C11_10550 [Desulfotomaculum sp. 1211_IL3151]
MRIIIGQIVLDDYGSTVHSGIYATVFPVMTSQYSIPTIIFRAKDKGL